VEVPGRRGLRTTSRCHTGTPGRSLPPPPRPRPVAPDAQPETRARATPRRRLPNLTSPPTAEPTGPERFRWPRTSPGTAAVAHPRTNTAANCRDLAPPALAPPRRPPPSLLQVIVRPSSWPSPWPSGREPAPSGRPLPSGLPGAPSPWLARPHVTSVCRSPLTGPPARLGPLPGVQRLRCEKRAGF